MLLRCVNCACSFADDACSAFEDFEENPQNSSLGSMLPCIKDSFSGKLIGEIGNTIHSFIVEVQNLVFIHSLTRKCTQIGFFLSQFDSSTLCSDYNGFFLLSQLNSNMSVMYRLLGVGEENEELIGVMKICDPFSGAPNYTYIPQSCPRDAIRIGDLPKVGLH